MKKKSEKQAPVHPAVMTSPATRNQEVDPVEGVPARSLCSAVNRPVPLTFAWNIKRRWSFGRSEGLFQVLEHSSALVHTFLPQPVFVWGLIQHNPNGELLNGCLLNPTSKQDEQHTLWLIFALQDPFGKDFTHLQMTQCICCLGDQRFNSFKAVSTVQAVNVQ